MSISPSEKIKVSIDGNIATIVIDNPGAVDVEEHATGTVVAQLAVR